MPPLPDSVSVLLRSSSTAAMAALLLISASHRGLLDWFSRTVCGEVSSADLEPQLQPRLKSNGGRRVRNATKTPKRAKPNGVHREPRGNGAVSYSEQRRAERDKADDRLVGAIKDDPSGTLGSWAEAIGRSRSSVVGGLQRLREAGLAESVEGKWTLLGASAPRASTPRWVAPLKATDRAAQAHLNAAS
jgi:hypothetical protein